MEGQADIESYCEGWRGDLGLARIVRVCFWAVPPKRFWVCVQLKALVLWWLDWFDQLNLSWSPWFHLVLKSRQFSGLLAIIGENIFHLLQYTLHNLLREKFQNFLLHFPLPRLGQILYPPGMNCSGKHWKGSDLFLLFNGYEDGGAKAVDDLHPLSHHFHIFHRWPQISLHPNLVAEVLDLGICTKTEIFFNLSDTVPGIKSLKGTSYDGGFSLSYDLIMPATTLEVTKDGRRVAGNLPL